MRFCNKYVTITMYGVTCRIKYSLWGISDRRVQELCAKGRMPGAQRLVEKIWVIPKNTPKPVDGRTKAAKSEK